MTGSVGAVKGKQIGSRQEAGLGSTAALPEGFPCLPADSLPGAAWGAGITLGHKIVRLRRAGGGSEAAGAQCFAADRCERRRWLEEQASGSHRRAFCGGLLGGCFAGEKCVEEVGDLEVRSWCMWPAPWDGCLAHG